MKTKPENKAKGWKEELFFDNFFISLQTIETIPSVFALEFCFRLIEVIYRIMFFTLQDLQSNIESW